MALNARIGLDLADFKKSIDQIGKDMSGLSSTMKGIGTAITGALSVGAVTAAVGKFTQLTGTLTDLSARTGISTTELQKLKFAAEQNGGTLEGVTGAIAKMGKALVEGKDSTVESMRRLGLSLKDVREMQPGQAFATLSDAIAKVPSPLERSTLAMNLFGKSGAELLPMMTGNLSETMEAAQRLGIVLDEETVAAGDNLGDTLGALQSVGMAVIGKVLAPMLPAIQSVANAMLGAGNIVDYLRGLFDGLLRAALMAVKGLVDGAIRIGEFAAKIPGLNKVLADEAAALQSARDASVWLGGAISGLEQTTKIATVTTNTHRTAVGLLTEEDKKATKAKKEKKEATAEEIHALGLLADANRRLEATRRWEEEVGRKNLAQLGEFASALPTAIFRTQSFAGAIAQVSEEAATFQGNLAGATTKVGLFEAMFGSSKDFGSKLASTIMGAIQGGGSVVGSAAGMLGQTFTTHMAKVITGGAGMAISGALGGAINAILPGLGSLLGPLATKITSFFSGLFDRNKGRDLVEEFAKGFGGFDALHQQLLTLGAGGEQLWVKLTQGVGRNNPDQARAAIAEVTRALEAQKTQLEETATAAQTASAEQIAAQTKVKDSIAALDAELSSLMRAVESEAPEEFMGEVERQQRARIASIQQEREAASKALEELGGSMVESVNGVRDAIRDLPREIELTIRGRFEGGGFPGPGGDDKTPGFAGGTGGRFLDFGSGTLAVLHGRERVMTEAEGAAGSLVGRSELAALVALQERTERLLREQPRMLAIALQDALVLTPRRR